MKLNYHGTFNRQDTSDEHHGKQMWKAKLTLTLLIKVLQSLELGRESFMSSQMIRSVGFHVSIIKRNHFMPNQTVYRCQQPLLFSQVDKFITLYLITELRHLALEVVKINGFIIRPLFSNLRRHCTFLTTLLYTVDVVGLIYGIHVQKTSPIQILLIILFQELQIKTLSLEQFLIQI